jgi:hypothetical protein
MTKVLFIPWPSICPHTMACIKCPEKHLGTSWGSGVPERWKRLALYEF